MRNHVVPRLGLYLLIVVAGLALLANSAHAQRRPLVLVFAASYEAERTALGEREQLPQSVLAMRAVRNRLAESKMVEAVSYNPDTPLFVRTVAENKLRMSMERPTPEDRRRLGQLLGAVSLIVVTASREEGMLSLTVEATDVESGKTWNHAEKAGAFRVSVPQTKDTIQAAFPDDLLSTANLVVMRYLGGPLAQRVRGFQPEPPLPADRATARPAQPVAPKPEPPAAVPATPASLPAPPVTTAPTPPTPAPPVATPATPPLTPPVATTEPIVPVAPPVSLTPAAPPVAPTNPTTTPGPSVTPPRTAEADTRPLVEQAEMMIRAGDTNGGILALRRAVNMAPRSVTVRAALIGGYLAAGRRGEAASEARRALALVDDNDAAGRDRLAQLLAQSVVRPNDPRSTRAALEQVIRDYPKVVWPRLALGDLLSSQNEAAAAEEQYKAAKEILPTGPEAAERLAKLKAARGDFAGALTDLTDIEPQARFRVVTAIFDHYSTSIATTLEHTRASFDSSQVTREAFYNAVKGQEERVNALREFLKNAPPPGDVVVASYKKRVLAGSLLSQGIESLLSFLETAEAIDGAQATALLAEAKREIAEVTAPASDDPSSASSSSEGTPQPTGAAR